MSGEEKPNIEDRMAQLEKRVEELEKKTEEKISTLTSTLNEILKKYECRGLAWKDKAVQIIIDEGIISLQQLRELFSSLAYRRYKEKFLIYAKEYGIELLKLNRLRGATELFVHNPSENLKKAFQLLNENGKLDIRDLNVTNDEWAFILALLKKYYNFHLLFLGNTAVAFRSRKRLSGRS
jgi:ribulose 1,5-bisphosphate carboxylase large subunit-like protein